VGGGREEGKKGKRGERDTRYYLYHNNIKIGGGMRRKGKSLTQLLHTTDNNQKKSKKTSSRGQLYCGKKGKKGKGVHKLT